jgi:hypothetical protein
MAIKDWKKKRDKNPYITHSWINTKKGYLLEIYYDIGFGKQRNVSIYNYRKQLLSGYERLHTKYYSNTKQALKFANDYMKEN